MSETEILSEADWQGIARSIRNGACVLLLGPSIAVDPKDQEHIPLTTVLARSLADRLSKEIGPECTIVTRDDLAHVSQVFCDARQHRGFGRADLETAVEQFYSRYDAQTTPLHRELAELPFELVINTTPDLLMTTACDGINKRYDYPIL